MFKFNYAVVAASILFVAACASESQRTIAPQETRASQSAANYTGPKVKLALGQFENRTNYMRGVFSTDGDVVGNQARTILKTHLQGTGRYTVLDRQNLEAVAREANFAGQEVKISGAKYVVTGDVVEFGRKNVGDRQLFGIIGKGQTQVAYAKVNILLVDITTSEVVHTAQGAGEVALSNREIVGFGGTAGYDATLTGKVLNLAIREAVDALAAKNVM